MKLSRSCKFSTSDCCNTFCILVGNCKNGAASAKKQFLYLCLTFLFVASESLSFVILLFQCGFFPMLDYLRTVYYAKYQICVLRINIISSSFLPFYHASTEQSSPDKGSTYVHKGCVWSNCLCAVWFWAMQRSIQTSPSS